MVTSRIVASRKRSYPLFDFSVRKNSRKVAEIEFFLITLMKFDRMKINKHCNRMSLVVDVEARRVAASATAAVG